MTTSYETFSFTVTTLTNNIKFVNVRVKSKNITTIIRKKTICVLKMINAILLTCHEFILMAY